MSQGLHRWVREKSLLPMYPSCGWELLPSARHKGSGSVSACVSFCLMLYQQSQIVWNDPSSGFCVNRVRYFVDSPSSVSCFLSINVMIYLYLINIFIYFMFHFKNMLDIIFKISIYSLGLRWWLKRVKHLPVMRETQVWSLGWEDPLEKEMATHSSILAWKIPWMEEPGRL